MRPSVIYVPTPTGGEKAKGQVPATPPPINNAYGPDAGLLSPGPCGTT